MPKICTNSFLMAPLLTGLTLAIICAGVPTIYAHDTQVKRDAIDDGVFILKSSPDMDSGPLSGLFDMANGFSRAAFGDADYIIEFVNETIKKIDDHTMEFGATTVWEVLRGVGGFLFCVLFGLLFLILLPIVGVCFCCCRCAGNCGGNMYQKQPETATKQRAFQCVLTMVILVILAGCACMFGIFVYLNGVIPQIQPLTNDVIDDVGRFARKTRGDVQELSSMMVRDIRTTMDNSLSADSIEDKFNKRVMNILNEGGRLNSVNASVRGLQKDIVSTNTTINKIQDSVHDMKSKATALMDDLKESVNTINSSLSACGEDACVNFITNSELVTLQAANFDSTILKLDIIGTIARDFAEIANEDYPNRFQQGVASLNEKIRNSSAKAVNAAKKQIDDVDLVGAIQSGTKRVTDGLKKIEDLRSEAHDMIKYFGYPQKFYDTHGHAKYAFVGVPALLMLLWVILPLIGLILGLCGGSPLKNPLKRSSASSAGGHVLMGTIYLTFIFSWIFMMVTCLAFITGAILENLGCRPLKDITMLGKIEAIASRHGSSIYGALPVKLPLPRNITVSGVLKTCEDNADFFSVLGFDQALDQMIKEYKEKFDVDSQVQKVTQSIDFKDIQIMPPELETVLDHADRKIKEFNYTTAKREFSSIDLGSLPDPTPLVAMLTDLAGALSNGTQGKDALHKEVANLNRMAREVEALKQSQNVTLDAVEELRAEQETYITKISELKSNLNGLQDKVTTDGKDMVETAVRDFADDIMSGIEALICKVKLRAQKLLRSGCHVLTTLYHTVVDKIICGYLVAPFNGFWFSLGQCVVFSLQIIIFGTLLAKFYRRMRSSNDDFDYPRETWPQSPQMEMNDYSKMPLGYPVYPKDAPYMKSKSAYQVPPE